ncbi:MAG: sulfatase-like hydrolase/transferase, partial [Actinobacteria bacterium]|nr:sulfatase-like hydrolase/transferase [Actinomycetota bacterium]
MPGRSAFFALSLIATTLVGQPQGGGSTGAGPALVDPGSRPNLVVVLTDDQSAYSEADLAAAMPWLAARLADPADHWLTFSNAFLNTPLCCPTRASLLTGQYSHHTDVQENSQALQLEESDTLATWLDAAGYRTGLFGKYMNGYPMGWKELVQPGWDRWFAFEQFSDRTYAGYYNYAVYDGAVRVEHGTGPEDYSTDVLADEAVEFVETTPDGTPFLLYLSPFAPHGPQIPAPRHVGALSGYSPALPPSLNEKDVSDKPAWVQALPVLRTSQLDTLATERLAALETLLAVDEAIARIAGALEARGQLEETVIVVMTDNGYSFGEHRLDGKRCGYVSCARTPFFVRYPGASPVTDARPVSSVDLAPTFVELAGAHATIPIDGRSLVPILEGQPTSWPEGVLIEYIGNRKVPGYWGVRTTEFAYLELDTGEVELYDLAGVHGPADPDELENRCPGNPPVCQPPYAGERTRLAELLAALKSGEAGNTPPTAVAQAAPTNATVGQAVSFDASGSSDAEDAPAGLTYEWDFEGDGTYDANGAQVSHAYPQPGTYDATLRVTD